MVDLNTTEMISAIVKYIGSQLAQNETIKGFLKNLTAKSVDWVKSIFTNDDGTEKEVIQKLKEKPDSIARQKALESEFEIILEDQPEAKDHIKDLFEEIAQTEEGSRIINQIINSKNVNTGNVTTGGGDFKIGD